MKLPRILRQRLNDWCRGREERRLDRKKKVLLKLK